MFIDKLYPLLFMSEKCFYYALTKFVKLTLGNKNIF